MDITEVQTLIKKSPFNKENYQSNFPLFQLIRSLSDYVHDGATPSSELILSEGVPEFQRANNKWSVEMQQKFVENLLKGMTTTIQLYILEKDHIEYSFSRCRILDGLQRTTAILAFLDGNLSVFGGLYRKDLDSLARGLHKIVFQVFRFNTQNEAIDFYIEMNENITHSPEDIAKARSFRS